MTAHKTTVPGPRAFRLRVPPVSGMLRLRLIAICLSLSAALFQTMARNPWPAPT